MRKIIDTNVPVIAGGLDSPQASLNCRAVCVQLVRQIMSNEIMLVIDDLGNVIHEYRQNLYPDPTGGLGGQFLYWVLSNQGMQSCLALSITAEGKGFREFPADDRLRNFDPSDRKWVALAVSARTALGHSTPIAQAADEKWRNFQAILSEHEVVIDFICDATDNAPSQPVKQSRRKTKRQSSRQSSRQHKDS